MTQVIKMLLDEPDSTVFLAKIAGHSRCARRLVAGGGVRLNGVPVCALAAMLAACLWHALQDLAKML